MPKKGNLRPVLTNHQHNFFHWLIVVLIRVFLSIIEVPLSVYAFTIGYSLSIDTLQSFLPEPWQIGMAQFSTWLPYFSIFEQGMFNFLNHWYQEATVWWAMVVGLPLMAMGVSLFLSNFFSLYYALFSRAHSLAHCFFCKKPVTVKMNHKEL